MAGSCDFLPAKLELWRCKPHAGMSDLMPYRLRFEKRQRLQRQKARHENRIEQDAACQSEIQPFFQHQCRSSHRETASISGEQTDRQALQGYATREERCQCKKRGQRLQERKRKLKHTVQPVQTGSAQKIPKKLWQRQA